jgi:hypothetical protein
MLARPVLSNILENDALTRGLADPEARILVEWLVEQAEQFQETAASEESVAGEVKILCRRARAIVRFVDLWCHQNQRGAATQLAASERFHWPLPTTAVDPCELMESILDCEAAGHEQRLTPSAPSLS